jgi:hypothetical protein
MQKNHSGTTQDSADSKVDAVAAVVLIFCVAGMLLMWVASH